MNSVDPKYPLIWNVRYAMRFGRRQSRLLDRIAFLIRVLIFAAGTAAFASIFSEDKTLVGWIGLAVAVLAIIDTLWNPGGRASKSREMQTRYALLYRDVPRLTAEELQRELDGLYDAEIPELESLRPIAYNDTVAEFGNSAADRYQLTPWQKFVEKIA